MCRTPCRKLLRIPTAAVIAIFSSGVGCTPDTDRIRTEPAEGADLPIVDQVQGTHCHETRPMRLVIRDAEALAQVPLAEVPVRFPEQMLLVVTLGRITSDQCSVRIRRVWREKGRLRVRYEVTPPPTGAPLAMASPFCIAVVPRSDMNVDGFASTPPPRVRTWEQSTVPQSLDKP